MHLPFVEDGLHAGFLIVAQCKEAFGGRNLGGAADRVLFCGRISRLELWSAWLFGFELVAKVDDFECGSVAKVDDFQFCGWIVHYFV